MLSTSCCMLSTMAPCQVALSLTVPRLGLRASTGQGLFSIHSVDKGSLLWERAGKEGIRSLALWTQTINLPL